LQLNFINAPAADVAQTVLASTLGKPLAVAEGVTARITLISPEPVSGQIALRSLEEVLLDSGLTLSETDTGFILTTTKVASEKPLMLRQSNQFNIGYGITVHPVKHSTASEVYRLVQPFFSSRLVVTQDDINNLLFLKGPQTDVDAALDAIK